MTFNLNPAQLVLSGVCATLLVVLGYLLFAPLPEISVPQVHARVQVVEDDTPLSRFEAPPMAAFADVDDRSVFNPARVRVSSPSVAGAANATTLPSDISLVGVILDGEKRLALLKSPQAPLAVGLGVGGSIEGWQVTRVEADRVALRASGPEQELKLSDNKPTADSTTNGPNGGRGVGQGNLRRPFPRQPGFQRPGMNNPGDNGPNNPNANSPVNPNNPNANNPNNNNNSNNDDDDDNNN